jgi:AraC-like DNA-binding protein
VDELRRLIRRHARPDELTPIEGMLLSVAETAGEPRASTTGTVFALIVEGSKRLALGDRVYDYGPGQYLVASVDLPITGHYTSAPALGFGLVLRPWAIASMVLEVDRRPAPPGLGVADATDELLDAVTRMVRLLDQPRDQAFLAPLIEREILWRLMNGPLGETVRQAGVADSSLTHVGNAVRWITEHFDQAFRVEDLARDCGMSTSAFHRAFHAVTALSPIQFQKQIRLQQSRLLLLSGAHDIATVGWRVGYDSTSQFSREYKRQFGLPPGKDATRLRAAV